MRTAVDETLRHEAVRFRLRFGCEHCAHFAPERAECAEGFPCGPHRGVQLESDPALEFCKSFELV